MRPTLIALLACLALFGLEEFVHARVGAARAEKAIAAALAFEATLSPAERRALELDFEDGARAGWHFVPGDRKGLALGSLEGPARKAAHELLGTLLSARGYLKVVGIMDLENTLREIEHNDARDPGRYWLAFFGRPGSGAWTLRFEGHHVSLSLSGEGAEFRGVTPFFLGTNPACVPAGPHAGLRILRREEELARGLFLGLDAAGQKRATLPGEVPADVILSPGRAGCFEKPEGLSFAELPAPARSLAFELVDEIVGDLAPEAAEAERAKLLETPLEGLRFAWCGGTREGEAHYWRISGRECAFELDNVQGGANHVHRLWRSKAGDLGGDALLEHYRAEHKR